MSYKFVNSDSFMHKKKIIIDLCSVGSRTRLLFAALCAEAGWGTTICFSWPVGNLIFFSTLFLYRASVPAFVVRAGIRQPLALFLTVRAGRQLNCFTTGSGTPIFLRIIVPGQGAIGDPAISC